MTHSRHTRLLAAACIAALVAAAPAEGAGKRKKPRPKKAASVPTIVIDHKYDAGGNGAPIGLAPGQKVNLFDPVGVVTGLGNQALGQLGLPPVPPVPPL